jgi:riboflavin kinase/FMN adenylyltransferase
MVLRGHRESFYLTTPEEKAALLGELGVDLVITYPFSQEAASLPAKDFIQKLIDHLGFKQLLVGYDFALGHNRQGDVPTLTEFGREMDFSVQPVGAFKLEEELVSSSIIRRMIAAGDMKKAAYYLGRPFSITGRVEEGDGRGHSLGFPTANLSVPREKAVPGSGVYACQVDSGEKIYRGVTNVGIRPTFEKEKVPPRVETHLLDFSGDLYGEKLKISFLERLRGEQRFSNAEELVEQIHKDISEARRIFTPTQGGSP